MYSKSFLLYADERVDLKKSAYDFAYKLYDKLKITAHSEDIKYFENIKIADVRNIIELSQSSSYSGFKVFILNFEKIRNEASNALLKLLEEPPINTCFIITKNNLNILSTILSRVIKIKVESKKFDIAKYVYLLLEAKEKFITKYLEENIDINMYSLNSYEEISDNLIEYFKNKDNIYAKIKFELSLDYIVYELYKCSKTSIMLTIQQIIDILEKDRDNSIYFLNRILVRFKDGIKIEKYIQLVKLKNSLKNNVSVKNCLYISLNLLIGE